MTEHDLLEQTSDSCWIKYLDNVFPFFLTSGFYFKLHEDTTLIGSPAFKYVAAVNVEKLSEMNSPSPDERVIKVEFSAEGNTIYVICEESYKKELVIVLRMSDRHILVTKAFWSLVSLIPVKEGVVLYEEHKVPELWNFELNQCIRSFTELTNKERLFPISDKLIACQRNRHAVNLSSSFTSEFPRKPTLQEKAWDPEAFEGFPPLIFNIPSQETASSYREEMADTGAAPVPVTVDILDVSKGALVSSMETVIPLRRAILFISYNSHQQLFLCTTETINVAGEGVEMVNISLSNNGCARVWERSSVWYHSFCSKTELILSSNEDLVVTWKTLQAGYGIHILDAKTGETRYVFLEDHADHSISGCKFVGDGKSLVCCSRSDNFLRLFNVRSGELLSVLDVGEEPSSLGACLGKSLVAIGLMRTRLKFIHVELPSIKDAEEKKG